MSNPSQDDQVAVKLVLDDREFKEQVDRLRQFFSDREDDKGERVEKDYTGDRGSDIDRDKMDGLIADVSELKERQGLPYQYYGVKAKVLENLVKTAVDEPGWSGVDQGIKDRFIKAAEVVGSLNELDLAAIENLELGGAASAMKKLLDEIYYTSPQTGRIIHLNRQLEEIETALMRWRTVAGESILHGGMKLLTGEILGAGGKTPFFEKVITGTRGERFDVFYKHGQGMSRFIEVAAGKVEKGKREQVERYMQRIIETGYYDYKSEVIDKGDFPLSIEEWMEDLLTGPEGPQVGKFRGDVVYGTADRPDDLKQVIESEFIERGVGGRGLRERLLKEGVIGVRLYKIPQSLVDKVLDRVVTKGAMISKEEFLQEAADWLQIDASPQEKGDFISLLNPFTTGQREEIDRLVEDLSRQYKRPGDVDTGIGKITGRISGMQTGMSEDEIRDELSNMLGASGGDPANVLRRYLLGARTELPLDIREFFGMTDFSGSDFSGTVDIKPMGKKLMERIRGVGGYQEGINTVGEFMSRVKERGTFEGELKKREGSLYGVISAEMAERERAVDEIIMAGEMDYAGSGEVQLLGEAKKRQAELDDFMRQYGLEPDADHASRRKFLRLLKETGVAVEEIKTMEDTMLKMEQGSNRISPGAFIDSWKF